MICLIAACFLQSGIDLKPIATVSYPALSEISGIAQSKSGKDLFWVHNDSGDKPRIFAIKRDGSAVARKLDGNEGIQVQKAKNVDWEEICADAGKLFISDLGNNGNTRQDLGIYVVAEPDPLKVESITPIVFWPISYPDQVAFPPEKRHFDCEAIFVFKGKVHVLTKHRMPNGRLPETGTKLYRLDTAYTDKKNVLTKLSERSDMRGWVTAASVSPNRKLLAVLTHFPVASIWIFDLKVKGDDLLAKPLRWVELRNAKQCEAISFDGADHLLIANEQRELFRVALWDVPKV